MRFPRYLPHLLYATALTSAALNLISKRAGATEKQRRALARISVLEAINERLKSGENVSDTEIERLQNLVRDKVDLGDVEHAGMTQEKEVDWKSVFLGRRKSEGTFSVRSQTNIH